MAKTKFSIKFTLLPQPHADGSQTIRISVSWKMRRVLGYLPVSVFADQWDSVQMKAMWQKSHKNDLADINSTIVDYTNRVTKFFDAAALKNQIPTTDEIKELLQKKEDDEEVKLHPIDVTIDEFVREESSDRGWVPETANKFRSLKHDVLCSGVKNVEEFSGDGMRVFSDYLKTRNLENAVLMKKVSVLRWFLGWCRRKGYIDNENYKLYQPHLKCPPKDVIYLTWDELMQMYECNYGSRYNLARVRDTFCFCAFTGLRYSDAARLRWVDIRGDYMTIITKKTSDKLDIELNKFAKSIIGRCKLRQPSPKPTDLVLPAISIQKSNVILKECALYAKIDTPIRLVSYRGYKREEEFVPKWKAVTTHCARRTFVVNSLRLGIPAEVIMKWTGHSDFTAMKPYIAIVDELKKESMSKYDIVFDQKKEESRQRAAQEMKKFGRAK